MASQRNEIGKSVTTKPERLWRKREVEEFDIPHGIIRLDLLESDGPCLSVQPVSKGITYGVGPAARPHAHF